jgi:hypothetical protein
MIDYFVSVKILVMKNHSLSLSVILLLVSIMFFRCTPGDMDYSSTAKEIITKGEWSVDYYFAGQDKTAQYSSFHFEFLGNGTVEGTTGTTTFTGTWSTLRDVNRKELLNINITTPHLPELNDQWTVNEVSSTIIMLRNEGNDLLRLKRL